MTGTLEVTSRSHERLSTFTCHSSSCCFTICFIQGWRPLFCIQLCNVAPCLFILLDTAKGSSGADLLMVSGMPGICWWVKKLQKYWVRLWNHWNVFWWCLYLSWMSVVHSWLLVMKHKSATYERYQSWIFNLFFNVSAILMDFCFMLLMPEGRKGTILTVFLPGLCKPLSEVVNHSVAVGTDSADGQNQHFSNIWTVKQKAGC